PGEDRARREIQLVDQILQPPRMLVTAMNQDDRIAGGLSRRPLPIEQRAAIPAVESSFGARPHRAGRGHLGAAKRSREPRSACLVFPCVRCDTPNHGLMSFVSERSLTI